ncbi:S41 family peptidase [Polluticoccus soli]|uniref:S41 family peptidase n=1 Tax=Polluticoccus soli TaxID=3034150 RepID=UPI0023E0F31C|nr:S41 family peptidase [Flavipsychrobacter sp. JY13-12]
MRFSTLRILGCLLALSFTSNAIAQERSDYTPGMQFTAEQLKEDLHVLHETLTELDPALYRYKTKKQVDSMFVAQSAHINQPMTEEAFRKDIVLPAIVFLQDLHFVVYPSRAAEAYLAENGYYFPFDIKIANGKMYLWVNHSEKPEIAAKHVTEVLKINNVPASTIINKLKQYIVADGAATQTKKLRDIEASFRSYYSIAYGRPQQFDLQIKEYPEGKTSNVKVPAAKWRTIEDSRTRQHIGQTPPPGFLLFTDGQTAVLTLRSFDPNVFGMTDAQLEKFIDSSFAVVNEVKVKNLVLDIRGNYGGRMNYPGKVYSHLTDSDFKFIDRVELRYPHMFPSVVHTSLGRSFLTNTYGMRLDTVLKGDSIYVWDTYQWTFVQKPSKTPFTGKLYVLADGYTFSTTGLLASMLRAKRNNTVFIGEETGGAFEGCSGNLPMVMLPNSQLRVHFPIRKFVSPAASHPETNKGQNARGVIPDIEVNATIDQLLSGDDPVYNRAMQLINK